MSVSERSPNETRLTLARQWGRYILSQSRVKFSSFLCVAEATFAITLAANLSRSKNCRCCRSTRDCAESRGSPLASEACTTAASRPTPLASIASPSPSTASSTGRIASISRTCPSILATKASYAPEALHLNSRRHSSSASTSCVRSRSRLSTRARTPSRRAATSLAVSSSFSSSPSVCSKVRSAGNFCTQLTSDSLFSTATTPLRHRLSRCFSPSIACPT
mmetsp:Transcript_23696/g.74167  ORF Transcript_23696/g.74167 Transcript_23696/m.74167 type:complete len:220 (+) Transcript_23696:1465-2124(+)